MLINCADVKKLCISTKYYDSFPQLHCQNSTNHMLFVSGQSIIYLVIVEPAICIYLNSK